MQQLLQDEIQIVLEMDHPNIVKFHSCCYDNNYINIVMELIEGKSLTEFMVLKGGRIDENSAKMILFQVMCAIKYYHSIGIVHRDLKPDNIMISGYQTGQVSDLKVKLIDFGMAKI